MIGEFELIDRYFSQLSAVSRPAGVVTGIGDDAAVLIPSQGKQLVTATDTLVAGVHFPVKADPALIARRSLRVNLSDLAAMGAEPRWFTLALTLPEASDSWLAAFASGLAEDAQRFGCHLVGGDTTRGPLTISLNLIGEVAPERALLRSGARCGDLVFVSGDLGAAAAALLFVDTPQEGLTDWQKTLLNRYYLPEPCLELGCSLTGIASSAIDISDGLLADAGHIAEKSGVSIALNAEKLPISPILQQNYSADVVQRWQLYGGDDYQLCFTVPKASLALVNELQAQYHLACIGEVLEKNPAGRVICTDASGKPVQIEKTGYSHF